MRGGINTKYLNTALSKYILYKYEVINICIYDLINHEREVLNSKCKYMFIKDIYLMVLVRKVVNRSDTLYNLLFIIIKELIV